jgi:hypothetical protein
MSKLTKAALARKKPVTDEVLIPADDAQAAAYAEAKQLVTLREQRLSMAEMGGDPDGIEAAKQALADAQLAVDNVREDIRKRGTAFTLVGVGRVRYDELQLEHRPTEEQEKEDADKPAGERRAFNPKAFWPALLAECVPDSAGLTAEDWRTGVFENPAWGPGELDELRTRATMVNQGSRIIALGN